MTDRAAIIFNGYYTIQSRTTGEHRTFLIRTQASDAEFAPGLRLLALLTGPNNEEDYKAFAFVEDDGIHVWNSMRGEGLWEKYAEMIWSLALDAGFSPWAKNYSIMEEGRCLRCNRLLTTPESVSSGIGPVCAGR